MNCRLCKKPIEPQVTGEPLNPLRPSGVDDTRHMQCPAAEAPAETPRETFQQEGWAIQRKSDNLFYVTDQSDVEYWAGSNVATLRDSREDAQREVGYLTQDVAFSEVESADELRAVRLTRTVTVQVHEPAPRSEP